MQAIQQLTEPELDFVSSIVGAYRIRRLKAIAKSVRKSPSADLEAATLNSLITKLNALHLEALEAISPSNTGKVTVPMTDEQAKLAGVSIGYEGVNYVISHADVELPNIAPVLESLD